MSKRYIEIYSGRRNRQQYPSPANFVIPFGISSEVKDPVLNGAIYYNMITSYGFSYDSGTIGSSSNSGTVTLNSSNVPQTVIDAYKGLVLRILSGYEESSIILTYNPSTSTITLNPGFSVDHIGAKYVIDASGVPFSTVFTIPYQDNFGNRISDKEQAYINYYIIDELESNGNQIVGYKIYDYDHNTRGAYSSYEFAYTNVYTLRKSLPLEKWSLLKPTYINTDPFYGPLTPVITLPVGSSTIDNYYVGKYVYFSSNLPTSYVEFPNFKPIYGTFRIKECKVLPTLENELFVDYDQNDYNQQKVLPTSNNILNQGTILSVDVNNHLIQLSNVTPQNGSLYNGLNLTDTTTNQTIQIVGSGDFYGFGYYTSYGVIPELLMNIGDSYIITNNVINIVSLQGDNAANLDYIGTMVSVNQAICYDIELIELILPNTPLLNGTIISTYPFVYVHLKNVSSPIGVSPSTIYSNNPPSTDALFVVLITDITQPTTSTFVRLKCSTTVRVKFKPNDSLKFSVTLPDGNYVTPAQPDYFSPYEPNPDLQIHATFGIKPV